MSDWSFYERGLSLFPLVSMAKTPALESWEKYQTERASPEQIAAWAVHPWNTGVATGAVSGCIVLDADSLLARIAAEERGLPDTLTVSTPRGTHWYFQHPGWDVSNRAGSGWTRLDRDDPLDLGVEGWDLRGDGGYVVGPGSYYVPTEIERAKGKVEGAYHIERDVPIAPAPDWLLALVFPRAHKPNVPARMAETTSDYGRAALNREMAILTNATTGSVNDQVNLSAFAIAQLVAGGEITSEEAWGALQEALASLGIEGEEKTQGTLERGWAAGMGVPRGVDARAPVPPPEVSLGVRGFVEPAAPPPPGEDGAPLATVSLDLNRRFSPMVKPQFVGGTEVGHYFEGCVYIARSDEMFTPSGVLMGKSAFDGVYGGPHFILDYDGSKKVRSAWEMFRQNSQVDMPKAYGVCFRPELSPGRIVDIEGLPFLNIYVPIVTPRRKGDATPFLDHVRRMLPHGRDADLLLHWMASAVQNPGVKFHWWPVIQGAKGNGKSLLLRVMTHALGERYTHLVRADAVMKTGNQFNDWIVGKLFLGFEEIHSSEGRRDFVEIMKDTVTDSRLSTEGKNRGQGTSDNRANGMMLSNWKDACPVDDDERRFGIFFTAQQSVEDIERDGMGGSYFPDLYNWLRGGGFEIVTDFLAAMPLEAALDPAQELHRAPFTTSTQDAIVESRGPFEQEIIEAIESGAVGFRNDVILLPALRRLAETSRRSISLKRFRPIMTALGYVTHPIFSGQKGRPNNPLADGQKPVIFYRKAAPIFQITEPLELIVATEQALVGVSHPSNVVPIRR